MSIITKFIISTILLIIFVIISNIYFFQFFLSKYFEDYTSEVIMTHIVTKDINIEDIISWFSPEVLKKYKELDRTLWLFTTYLEKDVNKFINSETKHSNEYIEENNSFIQNALWWNPISIFMSGFSNEIFKKDTPEFNFVRHVLSSMLLVNLVLILLVIIFLYSFFKISFSPINKIILKLKNFKADWNFWLINYKNKDEFWLLINQLNSLSKRLSYQEKIRSRFLADVSHEIKTPITWIKCYLEWIQDWTFVLNDEIWKSLSLELDRLVNIVDQIMKYEQAENTEVLLNKENINIKTLFNLLKLEYSKKLELNNQKIILKNKDIILYADKSSLMQILHNIISNFIKYAWNNTVLEIWSYKIDNIVFLEIKDNWVWVDAFELPFLKEKFYQVDDSKSKTINERWVWIWLSVVSNLMIKHWWTFNISNNTPNWLVIKLWFIIN